MLRAHAGAWQARAVPACKLTPDLHAEIVRLLEGGNYRRHAAAAAGIDERTIRNWIKWGTGDAAREPFKSFARDVFRAENTAIADNVLSVQKAAADDWRAASWFLARKAPGEWGDKAQKEIRQQIEFILQVIVDELGESAAAKVLDAIASHSSGEESDRTPKLAAAN
jgi:hypothetical protein